MDTPSIPSQPDILDRDRPLHWNLIGLIASSTKYGMGNEWKHFENEEGKLVCEGCNRPEGMAVNDPFDPEKPIDFDTPTQVLCRHCVRRELPDGSDYL